jgi:hypothetical protein
MDNSNVIAMIAKMVMEFLQKMGIQCIRSTNGTNRDIYVFNDDLIEDVISIITISEYDSEVINVRIIVGKQHGFENTYIINEFDPEDVVKYVDGVLSKYNWYNRYIKAK